MNYSLLSTGVYGKEAESVKSDSDSEESSSDGEIKKQAPIDRRRSSRSSNRAAAVGSSWECLIDSISDEAADEVEIIPLQTNSNGIKKVTPPMARASTVGVFVLLFKI
jgi:hypothetical protein